MCYCGAITYGSWKILELSISVCCLLSLKKSIQSMYLLGSYFPYHFEGHKRLPLGKVKSMSLNQNLLNL